MESWTHFEFESGANPYIAFTKKNAEKNMRLWRKKGWDIEEIKPNFYVVHDRRGDDG